MQCRRLVELLKHRFGDSFGDADFVVVGDMNDYIEPGLEHESALRILSQTGEMENVLDRLPAAERWTHYYNGDGSYHQLDYIFISRSLAQKNPSAVPRVERRGQPLRVNRPGQPPRVNGFFPEVQGDLKASDHCPVAITLVV
jgi:predicted extracellular nuclease